MLELLFWLIVGHALADFALQSDAIAKGKAEFSTPLYGVPWFYWLTAHALIHGGVVGYITQSTLLGVFEFAFHWVIDLLKGLKITGIHEDQLLHVLCKVVWAMILFSEFSGG